MLRCFTIVMVVVGCHGGSSSTQDAASDAPADGAVDAAIVHATPPAAGPLHAPDGSTDAVFAITKLYLGGITRAGTTSSTAWADLGYDLDGLISTAASTDVCMPVFSDQRAQVVPDGTNGTDNAFGKLVLPPLESVLGPIETPTNQKIAAGTIGLLVDIHDLGTGADYNPIEVQYFVGSPLGMTPKEDGTDLWSLTPAGLVDPSDPTHSQFAYANSYVTGNTLVTTSTGTELYLPIQIGTGVLGILIRDPILTMSLSPDHRTATDGTIAGVIDSAQLTGALNPALGVGLGICPGATEDALDGIVSDTADILDGAQQNPAVTCTSISIGVGFDAAPALLGGAGPTTPPPTNPCP